MSALHPTVLIIDDDPQIHRYLRPALVKAGYQPLDIASVSPGLQGIATHPPDAIILDIELKEIGGEALLTQVRSTFHGPVLVLSARTRDIEKITALDLGADDYVTKPFDIAELLARLRVAFRRRILGSGVSPVVRAQGLLVDLVQRTVTLDHAIVPVTDHQYTVLARLAEAGGAALPLQALAPEAYLGDRTTDLRKVRLLIHQLRSRIETAPKSPLIIMTERHIGYRLNIDRPL